MQFMYFFVKGMEFFHRIVVRVCINDRMDGGYEMTGVDNHVTRHVTNFDDKEYKDPREKRSQEGWQHYKWTILITVSVNCWLTKIGDCIFSRVKTVDGKGR